ncbi:MAG: TIGR01777 family oxidoreductase, partial [Nocardioides sp.]
FLIAGSSGFLGTQLTARLRADGHLVRRLLRAPTGDQDASVWDAYAGRLDQAEVEAADVVVNLAGSPTAGNPHARKWATELRRSRVTTTRLLARAIAASDRKPTFLAGNGISYYGDSGDDVLTESAGSRGEALLTQVTRDWQSAADPAIAAGARVCVLRTAPVMDRRSAPLRPLLPLFKLGLGTRLSSGRQHMAMISLRDWVGAVSFLAADASVSGPINLCCVETPTNAEFTETLASLVGRGSRLATPAVLVRLATGELAPELLGSLNVRPQALLDAGYRFADPTVRDVLSAGLG